MQRPRAARSDASLPSALLPSSVLGGVFLHLAPSAVGGFFLALLAPAVLGSVLLALAPALVFFVTALLPAPLFGVLLLSPLVLSSLLSVALLAALFIVAQLSGLHLLTSLLFGEVFFGPPSSRLFVAALVVGFQSAHFALVLLCRASLLADPSLLRGLRRARLRA